MKLSELKPCAICRGPLKSPMAGCWYVLRCTQAFVSPNAVNAVMGTAQILGGIDKPGALAIAEALAPHAEDAVIIAGDKDKQLLIEVHICTDCYLKNTGRLLVALQAGYGD